MTFHYSAVVMEGSSIIEINGLHDSLSIETATHELTTIGLKIINIREATYVDKKIASYKKIQNKYVKKTTLPPHKINWWEKALKFILRRK
jgi:hypothetical protein